MILNKIGRPKLTNSGQVQGFRPRQCLGEIIEKTAKIDSLSGKKIKKMKLAHLHTVVFLNSSIFFFWLLDLKHLAHLTLT